MAENPAALPAAACKRVLVSLACLSLALMLVACSSSDDAGDSDASGGSGGSPASEGTAEPEDEDGDEGSGASGGEIDACAILLPEDVEALLGSVPEAADDPVGPFSSCGYYDTLTSFVQLQVCRCLPGEQFDRSVESGADFLEVEAEPVEGIGDKAYWFGGILWVQQGDVAMNLWLSRSEYFEADGTALEGDALKEVSLPDTRELALELLSRLP